jgi:membrane associated rhomboid family serine protease
MWFLPLYDENPSFRKPVITYAIMGLCLAWFFFYQFGRPPEAILEYGFIPARLFAGYDPSFEYGIAPFPVALTLLTTMISHGGFMHIFGNLFVMYLLADNVEDAIGHGPKFIAFAVITGTVGTLGHGLANPDSEIPLVGLSGVCSAMIGAYILLWPRANIKTLIGFFIFFRAFNIPAVLIFAFWLFGQVSGFLNPQGNVAYDVHLYSLLAGMVLIPFFKRPQVKFFQKPRSKAFSRSAGPAHVPNIGKTRAPKRPIDPNDGKNPWNRDRQE